MTSSDRGWTRVRLGDVAIEYSQRIDNPSESGLDRFVGSNHIGRFELTVSTWGNTSDVTSAMKVFQPGDYLFVRRSLYASDFRERAARASFEGVCSGDILTIREREGAVVEGFLSAVLNDPRIWAYVVAHATGSITRRIKWRQLREYEFALPPLEEQRRIVDVLLATEECIQATSRLASSLEELFTSSLEDYISEAAKRCPSVAAAELLTEPPRNGISPSTNSDGLGLRTVSISAVGNGRFEPKGNIKFAEVEEERAAPFFVKAGDVFAIRGNGNRHITGKAGVASRDYDGLFYPDLLIRLRFDEGQVLPGFALAQWNLPSVHRRLIARAKSSNGIWKVNGQDIRAHTLFIPTLSEQHAVLEKLRKIQLRKHDCENRRDDVSNMKATLLRETLEAQA